MSQLIPVPLFHSPDDPSQFNATTLSLIVVVISIVITVSATIFAIVGYFRGKRLRTSAGTRLVAAGAEEIPEQVLDYINPTQVVLSAHFRADGRRFLHRVNQFSTMKGMVRKWITDDMQSEELYDTPSPIKAMHLCVNEVLTTRFALQRLILLHRFKMDPHLFRRTDWKSDNVDRKLREVFHRAFQQYASQFEWNSGGVEKVSVVPFLSDPAIHGYKVANLPCGIWNLVRTCSKDQPHWFYPGARGLQRFAWNRNLCFNIIGLFNCASCLIR